MRVYRIERRKYLDASLKGVRAARSDGFRWNSKNTYLVYTAASRALATLEVSVHLDLSEDLADDRYYVEIIIPEEVLIIELPRKDLPENWDAKPPVSATQHLGDNFVPEGTATVLKVPGSIVPPESDYLINPHHSDAKKIKVVSTRKMSFDHRFKF